MQVRYLQHPRHGTVQLMDASMPSTRGRPNNSGVAAASSSALSSGSVKRVGVGSLRLSRADAITTTRGALESNAVVEDWDGEEEAGDDSATTDTGAISECQSVPLPIQIFLWRQSNPFLGARNERLHDATCVTFERVVVQNILHGLSPSLSDAIASVSRWRFIRAAFPHIIQCCGSLLSERAGELQQALNTDSDGGDGAGAVAPAVATGERATPMSSSLVKILYILHWLLIDAAVECNEGVEPAAPTATTTADNQQGNVRNFTYPISSIQLFVYHLAPLFCVVTEQEIGGHIRLESGLRLWQALWQGRLPDIFCFCAAVKQRRGQLAQPAIGFGAPSLLASQTISMAGGNPQHGAPTAAEQYGIYVGEGPTTTTTTTTVRRTSQHPSQHRSQQPVVVEPPPKPPRSDLTVLRELELRVGPSSPSQTPGTACCSIVRSISDYKTNELAEKGRQERQSGTGGGVGGTGAVRKSKTACGALSAGVGGGHSSSSDDHSSADPFNYAGIADVDRCLHFAEGASGHDSGGVPSADAAEQSSLSTSLFIQLNQRAPIVQLHDICSGASVDNNGMDTEVGVEGGPETALQSCAITPRMASSREESPSNASQQTMVAVGVKGRHNGDVEDKATASIPTPIFAPSKQPTSAGERQFTSAAVRYLEKPYDARGSRDDPEVATAWDVSSDPREANYLDVAVLRCLLVKQWNEAGVLWSVNYLLNRLSDIKAYKWILYDDGDVGAVAMGAGGVGGRGGGGVAAVAGIRNRSSSVPHLILLSPGSTQTTAAYGEGSNSRKTSSRRASRHDVLAGMDNLTWAALQQHRKGSLIPVNSFEKKLSFGWQRYGNGDHQLEAMSSVDTGSVRGVAMGARINFLSSTATSSVDTQGLLASRDQHEGNNRRISVNTLPPGGAGTSGEGRGFGTGRKVSFWGAVGLRRARSEPNVLPSRAMAMIMAMSMKRRSTMRRITPVRKDCHATVRKEKKKTPASVAKKASTRVKLFFPEAIGSSAFIERNGHLRLSVLTLLIEQLVDRVCSSPSPFLVSPAGACIGPTTTNNNDTNKFSPTSISIIEVMLNICDTLLNMPSTHHQSFFDSVVNVVLQVFLHLGCAHGCNEGWRSEHGNFLRLKLRSLMMQMHRGDPALFAQILRRRMVEELECQPLLDTLHAMTLFCQSNRGGGGSGHGGSSAGGKRDGDVDVVKRRSSGSSPDRQQCSRVPAQLPSYRNNFNQGRGGVESICIGILLAPIVSKLLARQPELASPENMALFQDVRSFLAYVYERHGQPLRRTALSALSARLCDTVEGQLLQQISSPIFTPGAVKKITPGSMKSIRSDSQRPLATTQKARLIPLAPPTTLLPPPKEPSTGAPPSTSMRRGLFHRRDRDRDGGGSGSQPSASVTTPQSDADSHSPSSRDGSLAPDAPIVVQVEDGARMARPGAESAVQVSSMEPALPFHLPPRRLLVLKEAKEGVRRFTFLLESCRPGLLPDAPLMGALMELKAPVACRAALLLECAYFVNRCNRGDWPEWTKSAHSIQPGGGGRGMQGLRRVYQLQRTAGRAFYSWAIQLTSRLGVLLAVPARDATTDKRVLKLSDDLEDFLDEATVNDDSEPQRRGDPACPPALQLVACHLLLQITAFLRETFQSLPRTRMHKGTVSTVAAANTLQTSSMSGAGGGGGGGSGSGWGEKLMSHRRWSILSNTFTPAMAAAAAAASGGSGSGGGPPSAGSIQSINELHPGDRRVSYSTADDTDHHAPQQPLYLSTPRGSKGADEIGEPTSALLQQQQPDKKGRRLAQGRQRLLERKRGSPTATHAPSQFVENCEAGTGGQMVAISKKRESIKLRKISKPSASSSIKETAYSLHPQSHSEETTTATEQAVSASRTRYCQSGGSTGRAHLSPLVPTTSLPSSSFVQHRSCRNRGTSFKKRFGQFRARSMHLKGAATVADDSPSHGGTALATASGVSEQPSPCDSTTDCASPVSSSAAGTPVSIRRQAWARGGKRMVVGFQSQRSEELHREGLSTAPELRGKRDSLRPGKHPSDGGVTTDRNQCSPTSDVQRSSLTQGRAQAQTVAMMAASLEEEEEEMMRNMPWINAVLIPIANRYDSSACTHETHCEPWCFQRVYRQCHRLVQALSVIYCDGNAAMVEEMMVRVKERPDHRQQMADEWRRRLGEADKQLQKRTSTPRRQSAMTRQSGVDRMPLALRGLLIEKLNEIEEAKSQRKAEAADDARAVLDQSSLSAVITGADRKRAVLLHHIRTQLQNPVHTPLSALLKAAILLTSQEYKSVVTVSWRLLSHTDPNVVSAAASMFICCAVKCADDCVSLMLADMSNANSAECRAEAARRFHVLWSHRFHVWLRLEEGAQMVFKVPPPGIDFTLPSPPVGQSQQPVVDPPWMPHLKTKVEELSLKAEEADYSSSSQTIMTMTRTRRKQKQEMVKRAVREAEEKQCELRQQFPLTAIAMVQQAAYEPALFYHQVVNARTRSVQSAQQSAQSTAAEPSMGAASMVGMGTSLDEDGAFGVGGPAPQQRQPAQSQQQQSHLVAVMPVAQPLFPSSILSVVPALIENFDDVQVEPGSGVTVGDACRQVAWNCLVEDTSLFLRHFLEKFTNRTKQEQLMALLKKLILSFRPLPSQMAYSLLNYLFGLVMFYVRNPCDGSDSSLAGALSLAWLVCPYVHGLYFKDLRQTLKKEQCDQAIMITANVPSAKKIVIHGPENSTVGVPTQFPVHEETQFQQILADSLDFFNIATDEASHYFLVDMKTGFTHNPCAYVRDFYFFHRSFYPQLMLVYVEDAEAAQRRIRHHALLQKLIEVGKVLLTHQALKYSPEAVIPQRIFFLHDEFTHLPSFPRRALESCFGMYTGTGGQELESMDSLHKLVWTKLMSDIFEKMENAFMFGDLHLFINVINGIMVIHCEDVLVLRRCMSTYLSMAIHFSTLFSTQGFFLIMPTILRCYSQRQTNHLFTQTIEFVCKQFYLLHRKPFLLQMFGSIADICDQNNNELEVNAAQVKAKHLFQLLLAMEKMNERDDKSASNGGLGTPLIGGGGAHAGATGSAEQAGTGIDRLNILSLVPYPKPLKALDLCYRDDPNSFLLLPDAMASCVTVCAFAPESRRSHQCMLIMQSLLPHYVGYLSTETKKHHTASAMKHELNAYTTLSVEMRALLHSCDSLCRGPQRAFADFTSAASNAPSSLGRGPEGRESSRAGRGRSLFTTAESPPLIQLHDPPTIMADEDSAVMTARMSQKRLLASMGWTSETLPSGGGGGGVHQSTSAPQSFISVEMMQREMFRAPRDALLTLWAMFVKLAGQRLKELARVSATIGGSSGGGLAALAAEQGGRLLPELLDHRSHARLADVAMALLKVAPYDPSTMGCAGLQKYFLHILPLVDWSVEGNRSALNIILRRLDKTVAKVVVGKRVARRRTNWVALGNWLTGLYNTLSLYPYIAHLHPLKTITQTCLRLVVGDPVSSGIEESGSTSEAGGGPYILGAGGGLIEHHQAVPTVIPAGVPPQAFCQTVLKLTAFLVQALGQSVFPLEAVCGPETLGAPIGERMEALLCHLLIPLFLLAATPGKEAIHFLQPRDLHFSLQLLYRAVNPPVAKQSLVAPNTATSVANLSSAALSTTGGGNSVASGRQGSVSVTATDRATASLTASRGALRDSLIQSVLLALRVIILAFHRQMAQHWWRVIRITRELLMRQSGGHEALIQFIDFLLAVNLPISVMVSSVVKAKLNQRPANEQEGAWQAEIKECVARYRLSCPKRTHAQLLNKLASELQFMREDFSTRPLEPFATSTSRPHAGNQISTAGGTGGVAVGGVAGDHSDSGSTHSVHRWREPPRRLSSSNALVRLKSVIGVGSGTSVAESAAGQHPFQSTSTIHEGVEEAGGESSRVGKSPSLPFNRMQQVQGAAAEPRSQQSFSSSPSGARRTRSTIGGLGMFRSVRWKRSPVAAAAAAVVRRPPSAASMGEGDAEDMAEAGQGGEGGARMKSLRGIRKNVGGGPLSPSVQEVAGGGGEEVGLIGQRGETLTAASEYSSTGTGERPRVVSFSTPHKLTVSSRSRCTTPTISDEVEPVEEQYHITSEQHLI